MKQINNALLLNFAYAKFYDFLVKYPSPMNISYLWNFGMMSGIYLVIQIITGLFLSHHVISNNKMPPIFKCRHSLSHLNPDGVVSNNSHRCFCFILCNCWYVLCCLYDGL